MAIETMFYRPVRYIMILFKRKTITIFLMTTDIKDGRQVLRAYILNVFFIYAL